MAGNLRRFLSNIICGCVYNKDKRKQLRVVLNSPMRSYIKFIKKNIDGPIKKIKTFVGYQARNLLISVNDEYIYKFPLRRSNSNELAIREKRILDALGPISPVYISPVDIYEHNGEIVRRYKFSHGTQLRQMPVDVALQNVDVLAPQIARFLYIIGCADPQEIRDLKPDVNALPGYMYGWCHGDIGDNFMVNMDTMQIVTFFDWEDAEFCNFSRLFNADKRSPHRELMAAVGREYDKLYNKGIK